MRCKTCHVVKHALDKLTDPDVENNLSRLGIMGEYRVKQARVGLQKYYEHHQAMHVRKRTGGEIR